MELLSLENAGISTAFHSMLLAHGLNLETLELFSDDRFLASELQSAGVSLLGDRVRIIHAVRKNQQNQA